MSSKNERVTFTLLAPGARQVFLAGTFNAWSEHKDPMKLDRQGIWKKEKKLAPGVYEYKFIIDGEWLPDPQNPAAIPNPHGTANSRLEVVGGSTANASMEAYIAKLGPKMEKWQREIEKLEAKAGQAKEAARAKYRRQIEALRSMTGEIDQKIEEVRRSGGHAWEEAKGGLEKAWKTLSETIKAASSKFK